MGCSTQVAAPREEERAAAVNIEAVFRGCPIGIRDNVLFVVRVWQGAESDAGHDRQIVEIEGILAVNLDCVAGGGGQEDVIVDTASPRSVPALLSLSTRSGVKLSPLSS